MSPETVTAAIVLTAYIGAITLAAAISAGMDRLREKRRPTVGQRRKQ